MESRGHRDGLRIRLERREGIEKIPLSKPVEEGGRGVIFGW
jgi:hypothetical protein